jgi:hypothetical protein
LAPGFDIGNQRLDGFDILAAGQWDRHGPGSIEPDRASATRADDKARQRGGSERLEGR